MNGLPHYHNNQCSCFSGIGKVKRCYQESLFEESILPKMNSHIYVVFLYIFSGEHQKVPHVNHQGKCLTLSGPGPGPEARMAKLTAANQKPLIL